MINSAVIAGGWMLFAAAQVNPVAGASSGDHAASIMPKKAVAARVVQMIRVDPPADPLTMPTDVAAGRDGVIYVADGVNDRVVMFDAQGSYSGELSSIGDVALSNPIGLAVEADNHLWITDNGHHRVVRVSPDRTGAEVVGMNLSEAPADAAPIDPTGIVVTPDGKRLYVVDNDHHRIRVRDNASGFVRAVGSPGASLGQLQWPFLAALDADGALYVTEAIGGRAQRLDRDLQWTSAIGRWGVSEGQLYRPKGVAVDGNNRVLVGDSTLGAVQVFNSRGRFLGVLTDKEGRLIRFAHPMGMAMDSAGRLLVVEAGANQVSVVEFLAGGEVEGSR